MRAAVFSGPEKIEVQEIETPTIGSGDLLVKVDTCAVCGTDIRIYLGKKTKGVRVPSVIGHEVAGEIVEVGSRAAKKWQKGDKVVIAPVVACKTCYACRKGLENVCFNRTAIGYEFDGGFAQYVKVPQQVLKAGNVFKIPEGVSCEEAALVEPLSCCLNGSENTGTKKGDSVLIIGAGPIGLFHLQLAKLLGAKVLMAEMNAERCAVARRLGADCCFDPSKEDLASVVMQQTANEGIDKVIMAVGVARLVGPLLNLLKRGGVLNLFAGFSHDDKVELDPNVIHYKELKVVGSSASSTKDFRKALALVAQGKINLKEMITHRYGLDEIRTALDTVRAGQGLKVVVKP